MCKGVISQEECSNTINNIFVGDMKEFHSWFNKSFNKSFNK